MTDVELQAAVAAYLQMLADERAGRPFNKADVNAHLREHSLTDRSKGSVEYRMQNISAVLEELGEAWLPGYKPARNVGASVKQRIISMLKQHSA